MDDAVFVNGWVRRNYGAHLHSLALHIQQAAKKCRPSASWRATQHGLPDLAAEKLAPAVPEEKAQAKVAAVAGRRDVAGRCRTANSGRIKKIQRRDGQSPSIAGLSDANVPGIAGGGSPARWKRCAICSVSALS